MVDINIRIAEEAANLMQQDGTLTFTAALRQAKEMYKNSCNPTDQSKESNLNQINNNIIPPYEDIDNDQVYDIETGKTIKDL
ncbi:hypothetical protein [Clostridium sp. HBUAS56017]|uniref:hypothetical protein n=1 Tax=Clostridium sp. HBUAS56017 TaxID=2571128 RepID=UPI001177E83D|nr:hypothetical protein [Clostridium sp. HBUAS56017]